MPRRSLAALLPSAVLALLLSACAAAPSGMPSETAAVGTSDAVPAAGVVEHAEPALHLTTLAPDGAITHRDLDSGRSSVIARIAPAEDVVTDGRYLFAIRDGAVTIVDSGAWTWSHGDHFHYYTAPSRVVGDVEGPGMPTVVAGERSIGIHFDGGGAAGQAVLVKAAPLADGEIEELFRREAPGGAGRVIPLAYGGWVTERSGDEIARLRHVDEEGVAGPAVRCADAAGSIATVVGVLVACADGAVIAADGRPAKAERLAYPAPRDRARAFSGREGRPTVSALTEGGAVWVLDTRARAWHAWRPSAPVMAVAAIGDDAGRVVAVAGDDVVVHDEATGRVRATVGAGDIDAGAALFPEQHETFLVDREGAAVVIDHASGTVAHRLELPAGITVLTGR